VNVPFVPSLGQPAAMSSITHSISVRFFPFLFVFLKYFSKFCITLAVCALMIFELLIVKKLQNLLKAV
jgi:hypothetical protein